MRINNCLKCLNISPKFLPALKLMMKRIPENVKRSDWQVMLAIQKYGSRKAAAYHLRITEARICIILQSYNDEIVNDMLKHWNEQVEE